MSSNKQRAVTAEPHSKAFIEMKKELADGWCIGCEFVKIMNPEGLGYCEKHGDIDPGHDPKNHEGNNL